MMVRISTLVAFALALAILPSQVFAEPTAEVELIQEHLASVEAHLRARDVSVWPQELQEARAERLDELREYRLAGDFPTNNRHPGERVPYFIDDQGTACAVGHLMIESGAEDLARNIARDQNNAYVMEIRHPGLKSWVEKSGITAEEAVWIQPSYSYCAGIGVTVSGPTEASCGDQITLTTEVTEVPECPSNGVTWSVDESEFPPDALVGDGVRPLVGMNIVTADELVVQFDPEQDRDIEFVFTATVQNMGDSAAAVHRVRVDCGEPGWTVDEPEPDPENNNTGEEPAPDPEGDTRSEGTDEGCAAAGGNASLLALVLMLLGLLRKVDAHGISS